MKPLNPASAAALLLASVSPVTADFIRSPDGRVVVDFRINEEGVPRYTLAWDGKEILRESKLGLVREDADFSKGLRYHRPAEISTVDERYEILTAKRKSNRYLATRAVFHVENSSDGKMDIVFQVSSDGVGLRYVFPERKGAVHKIKEEATSFHFPVATKAWLQPMAVAKSGWSETNPSYEEYYECGIPVGTPSTLGAGWVYPALFKTESAWVLLSESAPSRHACVSRLKSESPDGEYGIGYPDSREVFPGGPALTETSLPWMSPWRVIAVGGLKAVTESMLGVDLADKPAAGAKAAEPGKASWSWPLLGDAKTVFEVQKEFVDYAADMGWKYTLVDAQWDQQIGDAKMGELVDYAKQKKVEILVWYNSAGSWNSAFQTPKGKLLTKEDRKKEFTKLKEMGVSGVKIDFFGGDGQSMIAYQQDILEETADYGLSVNFHGTTLPRGWQRTYPHFMTAEAIRGLEYATFEQVNADRLADHATMLPFTRNVFDPMDFTPMVLDRVNDKIQRRTTSGFELALSVLFTSGIQHYAEIPAGMAKVPVEVRDFIKSIPPVWEESRFIDGFPGEYVVMARKAEGRWFVSGIQGGKKERKLSLDLSALRATGGLLITDGEGGNLSFESRQVKLPADGKLDLTLRPAGGFVLTLDP